MAVALTATTAPAFCHPLAGEIDPPAVGLAAVVRKCWVVKTAVKVAAEEGPVTEWEAAPASDQLVNRYWVPVAPGWVAAAMVWLVPDVHCTEHGAAQLVPSTVSVSPAGTLATVTCTAETLKLAVTVVGPLTVRFCGFVAPDRPPEKPVKV